MLSVPRALTSKSVLGSTSEVVTATWPARCRMASWSRTCSASAAAFRTSSLINVVRFGYRVINHFRFRSVPGRLRLSSKVAAQPSLMRWTAALTPRNPAPPVIRMRRSGFVVRVSSFFWTYRALGSIAPPTLAREDTSNVSDAHDPRGAGQDQGLAARFAASRIDIGAGEEDHGERAVNDMKQLGRPGAKEQKDQAEQSLDRRDARHDQVGGPEPPADALVAKVVVCAPKAEKHGEHHQHARAIAMQKGEGVVQSGLEAGDLVAKVVDSEPQAFLEQDARLPRELLRGPSVVERDPVHVAFARRPEHRLALVLGQERELAEQVVDGDRDAAAHVVGASVSAIQGDEVCGRDVADMQHVSRLVAVTVDGDRLVLDHPAGEDSDHSAFFGKEVLACTVDVRVAQRSEREPKCPLEGAEILLEGILARAVRGQRTDRVILVRWHDVRLAIQSAARRAEDDLAHGVVQARLQHVEPAHHVDLGVVAGIGH